MFSFWLGSLCAVLLAFPILSSAESSRARTLAETQFFETLPFESAEALTDAEVRELTQWLEDPTRSEQHANIIESLGVSGSPRAYRALRRFAKRAPLGAVEAGEYRAQLALPLAMGHLARHDHRALRFLVRQVRRPKPVEWSYRHIGPERIQAMLQRAAISGLGISGHPRALEEIERLAGEAPRARSHRAKSVSDGHLFATRELHHRVAREGARRVFRGEP